MRIPARPESRPWPRPRRSQMKRHRSGHACTRPNRAPRRSQSWGQRRVAQLSLRVSRGGNRRRGEEATREVPPPGEKKERTRKGQPAALVHLARAEIEERRPAHRKGAGAETAKGLSSEGCTSQQRYQAGECLNSAFERGINLTSQPAIGIFHAVLLNKPLFVGWRLSCLLT